MKKRFIATALAGAFAALALSTASAAAPAYRLLYSFDSTQYHLPSLPNAGVIAGPDGALYGMSEVGGKYDRGAAYALNPADDAETVLYAFGVPDANDGRTLKDALVRDSAGNLYGVTLGGGKHGLGTVFKIDATTHSLTVLHDFAGGADDGALPDGPLLLDPQGKLFGTTLNGGPNDTGTVFEISPGGVATMLYGFGPNSGSGPRKPIGDLALDSAGHLYGTTRLGGSHDLGTVYKLTPGTGTSAASVTTLTSFAGGNDGSFPMSGVTLDATQQMLYGTTVSGGSTDNGTVFACPVAGGAARVVYAFQGPEHGDGSYPRGRLAIDDAGMLYGTTNFGGTDNLGTVFTVDPFKGSESVLHNFGGRKQNDGYWPVSGVIIDAAGELVGTTRRGGYDEFGGTIYALPR
jgi:uncharacterized repeat protein (TIGR03803 family)